MTRLQSRGKGGRGQALVEFVLVAHILVLLLLAIVQFGIVWMNYTTITDSAREGARRGIVQREAGQSAIVSAATSAAFASAPDLNRSSMKVAVSSAAGTWNQGDAIQVTVTYPYSISLLGIVVKSGMLSSTTVMRAE
jgi:Flp pilus assembly protein TadG